MPFGLGGSPVFFVAFGIFFVINLIIQLLTGGLDEVLMTV